MEKIKIQPGKKNTESKKRLKLIKVIFSIVLVVVTVSVLFILFYQPDPGKLEKSSLKLEVSEYMNNNTHYYIDGGEASQWLELHNYGKEDINLSSCFLVQNGKKRALPSMVLKGGKYIVFFDGSGNDDDHIRLSFSGDDDENFYIMDAERRLVDLVSPIRTKADVSVVRSVEKGEEKESVSDNPTPGFENSEKGLKKFRASRRIENETGIVISELMSKNENAFFDSAGNAVDFIELLNESDEKVDVSGFGLSENENNVFKFTFPKKTVIEPGKSIVVCCSSDYKNEDDGDEKRAEGEFRAPFSIKAGKESVFLSDPSAFLIDEIEAKETAGDKSLSMIKNGVFVETFNISPGFENNSKGVEAFRESFSGEKMSEKNVYISEASSRNTAYAPVEGAYYDWVELYNPTDKAVDLKGWSLSDEKKDAKKYVFPSARIEPKEYLVVYASDKNPKGVLCTGFDLNGTCAAYLSDKKGNLVDSVSLSELPCNVSKGRESGKSNWMFFETPTPGAKNSGGKALILDAPVSNHPSGKYDDTDELLIKLYGDGDIYYTTDGSEPSLNSSRYSGSISLKKTTVIRAISVREGAVKSPVATFSFLINEDCSLDVVSLVSDPNGFFSAENGIYATGGGASSEFPYFGANFWKDMKRKATVQLIAENEPGFSIDCQTSIFGGYSRGYEKKSLKLKFKDIYGNGKLKYPLFKNRDFDEYDALVLRAGGQDISKSLIRDDLTTYLADPVLDVMATRPVALYINGEYWGVYFLREKINAEFAASHYNVSPESVDMVQGNSINNAGSIDDWYSLLSYVKTHDLSVEENFEYVRKRVDLKNYADYIIAELYCGNTDAGNIRCFKSSELDNKWRWILYDTDMGFQAGLSGSVFNYLNPQGNGANNMFTTRLINGLLKNKKFRNLFVSRLKYQMHNIWNTERVIETIDMFSSVISSEVERNHSRWNVSHDWNANIDSLRSFAENRQAALKNEFANDSRVRSIIALSEKELKECFE